MFSYETALSASLGGYNPVLCVQQSSESTLGFKSFGHTRILMFSEPTCGELFIDFAEQHLLSEGLYIVPATHIYSYSHASNKPYTILDIDENQFRKQYRRLLYSIKYAAQKLVLHPGNCNESYPNLLSILLNNEVQEQQKIKTLCDVIDCSKHSIVLPNSSTDCHWPIAQQFIALIRQQQHYSLEQCAVEPFAQQLNCSVRTLRQVCFDVFHCSPSYIIKYHMMIYGIYLLAQGHKTVKVTKELGFSSIAAFDRFIKRLTNVSPSQLKQSLNKMMP